jgi:hypothetical protein
MENTDMGCACHCEIDDVDRLLFFKEKFVKARKQYKCVECGAVIRRGEKHHYVSGRWEDAGFEHFRTCLPCRHLIVDLFCGCQKVGYMRDAFISRYGFDYTKEV